MQAFLFIAFPCLNLDLLDFKNGFIGLDAF